LFERLPRGVRGTSAGEAFLVYARLVISELKAVESRIEQLRGLVAWASKRLPPQNPLPVNYCRLQSPSSRQPLRTFDSTVRIGRARRTGRGLGRGPG